LASLIGSAALALPEPPIANLRRRYLDGRLGQLHLREARPARGRLTKSPLVLLHQTPLSGRMFEQLLPLLAVDRLAIAVEASGEGPSCEPSRPSPIS
jgi:hypothetical protein